MLISQFAPHIEVYRRPEKGTKWTYTIYGPELEEEVVLESVNVAVPLAEIYEGINFDELRISE